MLRIRKVLQSQGNKRNLPAGAGEYWAEAGKEAAVAAATAAQVTTVCTPLIVGD